MRRSYLLLAAAGLVAATTAQAQSHRTARGHLLVQRYCASCHAVNRTGQSPNRDAPPFRDLNTRYRIDDLAGALAEGILTRHPQMPEFKFPRQDIEAIVAYIKKIQTEQRAAEPPTPLG